MLSTSQFGQVLKMGSHTFSVMFLHYLLSRQLINETDFELWWLFVEKPIRYAIQDFALITASISIWFSVNEMEMILFAVSLCLNLELGCVSLYVWCSYMRYLPWFNFSKIWAVKGLGFIFFELGFTVYYQLFGYHPLYLCISWCSMLDLLYT